MKRIQDIIEEQIKNAFVGAGYDAEYGKVGISNRPDLCLSLIHISCILSDS